MKCLRSFPGATATSRRAGMAVLSLMVLSTALTVTAADTSQPAPATARAVIEKVTQEAIAVLRDTKLSADQRRDKVRQIAFDTMDFQTLGRMSMGQPWRSLSDDQRKQFIEVFRTHVANTYGHTTDEYTDEDIKVAGDRQEDDGDWTVQTKIIGTENGVRKEVAPVDYRLRKEDGGWKIIDVIIDNVSLVSNFRSQFSEIMANQGFDQLMKMLREKNAAGDK